MKDKKGFLPCKSARQSDVRSERPDRARTQIKDLWTLRQYSRGDNGLSHSYLRYRSSEMDIVFRFRYMFSLFRLMLFKTYYNYLLALLVPGQIEFEFRTTRDILCQVTSTQVFRCLTFNQFMQAELNDVIYLLRLFCYFSYFLSNLNL